MTTSNEAGREPPGIWTGQLIHLLGVLLLLALALITWNQLRLKSRI